MTQKICQRTLDQGLLTVYLLVYLRNREVYCISFLNSTVFCAYRGMHRINEGVIEEWMKWSFRVSSVSGVLWFSKEFPLVKMQIMKQKSNLPDLSFLHGVNTFIEHICLFQRSNHSYFFLVIKCKRHFGSFSCLGQISNRAFLVE